MGLIAEGMVVVGAALVLLAGLGVVRFPDLLSRMHAATKASTLGILLVAVAAALIVDPGRAKVLLAAAVIFVTGPCAAHLVARSAVSGRDELETASGDSAPAGGDTGGR